MRQYRRHTFPPAPPRLDGARDPELAKLALEGPVERKMDFCNHIILTGKIKLNHNIPPFAEKEDGIEKEDMLHCMKPSPQPLNSGRP